MSWGDKFEPITQLLTTMLLFQVSTVKVHLKTIVPKGQGNRSEIFRVPILNGVLYMLFPLPKCFSFPPSLLPDKTCAGEEFCKGGTASVFAHPSIHRMQGSTKPIVGVFVYVFN